MTTASSHMRDPSGWEPWTGIEDRDEILERLLHLSGTPEPVPSQLDFVEFFFRSSDPVLYPIAATIVGRWLGESPPLAEMLARYMEARGVPRRQTIAMNGTRARRRVLIAAAAACALDPEAWTRFLGLSPEAPEPLAPLDAALPSPATPDMAAYMRACRILLGGPAGREALGAHAGSVLAEVLAAPSSLRDPTVARRWGELLAARAEGSDAASRTESARMAEEALTRLRPDAEALREEGVPDHLRRLRAEEAVRRGAGELLPAASALGDARESRILNREAGARERLRTASRPEEWWTHPPRERARLAHELMAFVVGDESLRSARSEREWSKVIDALGLPPGRRTRARIILQVAGVEGVDPLELTDASLLHSLEDEELLLRLIPRTLSGDLGGALADAVEHRLRMGISTEVEFSPEHFLARVEVRDPPPVFYDLLRAVVADRVYRQPEGEVIPLEQWLADLHTEAVWVRKGEGEIPLDSPIKGGRLAPLRDRIRAALDEMEGAGHAPALVERFLELSRSGGADPVGVDGGGPLPALVRELHGGGAESELSRVTEVREDMRKEVPWLVPERLAALPRTLEGARAVRVGLWRLTTALAAELPGAEAHLLKRAARAIEGALRHWEQELLRLDGLGRGEPEGPASRTRLVEGAAESPHPTSRSELLALTWRSISAPGEGASSSRETPEGVIRWAIGAAERLPDEEARDAWLGAVASDWNQVTTAAMEEGYETRVARLVREPGSSFLARLPGSGATLQRARLWFFDRYRIGDAALATRALRIQRGDTGVATLPRELLGFFLHYSPVWLALLVGAILMLDFGDAWRTMAEVGDVRGVAITFALGLLGAFGYVTAELNRRVRDAPGDRRWANHLNRLVRSSGFVLASLLYSVLVVSLLWWLLSGTDEVVHGAGALLHIVVWSGFALFVGVFFGLMAKS